MDYNYYWIIITNAELKNSILMTLLVYPNIISTTVYIVGYVFHLLITCFVCKIQIYEVTTTKILK